MTAPASVDQGLINLRWAFSLLDGLAAAGVRRAVISPGSRSTPLVLACEQHPDIETFVSLDERSAAFFALGQSKLQGAPSLLIATSGSAPSHWYPAVLEASSAHVPLLLLSADRPLELQDWGANQTLDQQRLFGSHTRAFYQAESAREDAPALRQIRLLGVKAVERASGVNPGPVHINIPFREPLVPKAPMSQWPCKSGAAFSLQASPPAADAAQIKALCDTLEGREGVIVCGPGEFSPGFASALEQLAQRLAAPVLADPLSGLRFGPTAKDALITRYDAFLRADFTDLAQAQWILRFGAAPVSKYLLAYLGEASCFQAVVAPYGDWPDPLWRSDALLRADPLAVCQALNATLRRNSDDVWLQRWRALERAAQPKLDSQPLPFEARIIQRMLRILPAHSVLFSGNSQPIRQLDSWSGSGAKPIRILANRGASGIDGNVSCVLGLASASERPPVALLGDLSLLHDLNGFLAAANQHAVFVLLNNGGGGIFGHLPQSKLPSFERYWLTPQTFDPVQLAALFGLRFHRVRSEDEFAQALRRGLAEPAVHLIEAPIDRRLSLQRHQAYWENVATQLGGMK